MSKLILRAALIVLVSAFAVCAAAQQDTFPKVRLHGTIANRAVLSVNGGEPRVMAIGQSIDGIKLIAVGNEQATIEADGKKISLRLNQEIGVAALSANKPPSTGQGAADAPVDSATGQAMLQADSRGHFIAQGRINGLAVTMMVDTGASLIAIPTNEAKRLGVNYQAGQRGAASTANGVVNVWIVRLDSVNLQGITLYNVEASVIDAPLGSILLGNSFLKRMQMRIEGERMMLMQRF